MNRKEEIRRLKTKIDELEDKSLQNENSLKTLKEFYMKMHKSSSNMSVNNFGLFPDTNNQDDDHLILPPAEINNHLNILDHLKNGHENILSNLNYNNNNKGRQKSYVKQCEFFSEKKAPTSEIDVLYLCTFFSVKMGKKRKSVFAKGGPDT